MANDVKTIQCENCGTIIELPEPTPEEAKEVNWVEQFANLTKEMEGAPTVEQIEEMKAKYGDVFFVPLSNKLVYLYRAASGAEYEKIFESVMKHVQANNLGQEMSEKALNEQLVYKCTIWPKITPALKETLPAGVVPTLAHLIHTASHFYDVYTLQSMQYSL